MLDMVGNRLSNMFPNSGVYNKTPFSTTELRDCIIASIIKAAYEEIEPKHSLRSHRKTDADDERMRNSRSLAYAQHYRTLQYEDVKERIGEEIPALLPDDMSSMGDKLSGHKITSMQFFELNTIADHPVFKAIVSKRICSVKKVSNKQFCEFMQDYENHRLPLGEYLINPSPGVRYSMKIGYLMEICDLIQIRTGKEDFYQKSCQILIYRNIDKYLSQLDDDKQKEELDKFKKHDKKLYDECIEWKKNSEQ